MAARLPGLSARQRTRLLTIVDREAEKSGVLRPYTRDDVCAMLRVNPGRRNWTFQELAGEAGRDIRILEQRGIGFVSFLSPEYPPLLREIYDPPPALFYRGSLPPWDKPLAAVVGTRHPTAAALEETYRVSRDLARAGVPVVSGLALGIDAMAHRGCLDGGEITVAVLGSGADMVYPQTNRNLAARILRQGGCLLSEYPPGTPPMRHHFPARNRIISALSRGVLVAEAPEGSGALITASFALEHGRDLWVGSAGAASPRGEGNRKLADDGAEVISDAACILREWRIPQPSSAAAAGDGFNGDDAGEYGVETVTGSSGGTGAAIAEALARSFNIDMGV